MRMGHKQAALIDEVCALLGRALGMTGPLSVGISQDRHGGRSSNR